MQTIANLSETFKFVTGCNPNYLSWLFFINHTKNQVLC